MRPSFDRWLAPVLVALAIGCGSDPGSDGPLGGSLDVTGNVLDFETQMPVSGAASISTAGLVPPPTITVTGADFSISGVPENSAFQLLASVPPSHRATYSPTISVTTMSVTGIKSYVVSEAFLTKLATGFSITPSAANGILLVQLTDMSGMPKSGITASNIVLSNAGSASGPHFLDANLAPSTATSSSASGWAVFFEVAPGVVSLGQAANATVALDMPSAMVGAATVTIANITVGSGAPAPLPTNVSFAQQVAPIFQNRGCIACHSGSGIGKDLGNLTLDGSTNKVYMELTGPEDPARVQVAMPEKSLVLTMPSAESPPDPHPNITFTSPQDPDYVKILVWIREGAKQN